MQNLPVSYWREYFEIESQRATTMLADSEAIKCVAKMFKMLQLLTDEELMRIIET